MEAKNLGPAEPKDGGAGVSKTLLYTLLSGPRVDNGHQGVLREQVHSTRKHQISKDLIKDIGSTGTLPIGRKTWSAVSNGLRNDSPKGCLLCVCAGLGVVGLLCKHGNALLLVVSTQPGSPASYLIVIRNQLCDRIPGIAECLLASAYKTPASGSSFTER